MGFSMFDLIRFCTVSIIGGKKSRPWTIIWDTDRWSILKFTCYFCWSRMASWLIILAKNHLFYYFNVLFCVYRFRLSRAFFSSNITSFASLFQQFLHTIYLPLIIWMVINNSCSTILQFFLKIFNNYFLFVWEHHIASY